MNRQDVEKTITEYLKPIFGFALKRCKNIHDAEDLSQEIVMRAFRALLIKDDIADVSKFIWTIAHNTLSNYYRDAAKSMVGVSIDEVAELIADPNSEFDTDERADQNFLLWSLIPYIAARSGEKLMDNRISFEEVATIRPDGAHNIFHASVVPDEIVLPENYVYMKNWRGPIWNEYNGRILWQIDSEWSDRGENHRFQYPKDAKHVLSLYASECEDRLSKDEYAWLAERGYVKTNGDYDGCFKAAWQIVVLASKEIQTKLLAIGERIKEKHQSEFDAWKAPYAKAVLESVPAHLKRIKEYELQFVFHSDGWFLVHCIKSLLNNGKLKEPTEGQKKALTTLILDV